MAEYHLRAALWSIFGPLEEAMRYLTMMINEPALGKDDKCHALTRLGWLIGRNGDFDEACRVMKEARLLIQNREDECWWAGGLEAQFGYLEMRRGHLATARGLIELATEHLRVLGDSHISQFVMPPILGFLLLAEGKASEAVPFFRAHIESFLVEVPHEMSFVIYGLAECALALEKPDLALWLLGVRYSIDQNLNIYNSSYELEVLAKLRHKAESSGANSSTWDSALVLPYDIALPLLLDKIVSLNSSSRNSISKN
jgi:hypothetical protein